MKRNISIEDYRGTVEVKNSMVIIKIPFSIYSKDNTFNEMSENFIEILIEKGIIKER